MADKIKFWYGSTSDINTPSSSNYPAVVRGQVYFAVDQLTSNAENGQIYFDVPIGTGTQAKRIIMGNHVAFATNASTALYASTAMIAKRDERNQAITDYIKGLTLSGHTLTITKGSNAETSITLPDDDYRLKVTSTGSIGSKIYLIGNSATALGTAGSSVTSTGITSKDIFIGTDGFLQGKIKTNGTLTFGDGKTFNGSSNVTVGDTIHYIPGTGTATTITNYSQGTATATGVYSAHWGGIVDDSITTLYSGLTIAYKIPVAGNGSYGNVLKLTKADGTAITNPNNTSANDGYYPVIRSATDWVTTHYPVNSIIILVFDADQVTSNLRPVNGNTMSITGCWKIVDYDSTNVYQFRHGSGNYITSTSVYRYALLAEINDTTLMPFYNPTSNANWTNTDKTTITTGFRPFGQFLYRSGTGVINTGGSIAASELWEQYTIDLRYSFNITSSAFTSNKNVYLVTSLPSGAEGLVTLDPTTPLVQDLPTTNVNKLYILLGRAYNGYCIELYLNHPVYTFQDGSLRTYSGYADYTKAAGSATNDSQGQQINTTYIKNISISGHKITFTKGNDTESTATLPDDDYRLKVTSTSSVGSKIYLVGNASSSLGTANNNVTSTGIVHKDIYIDTNGRINGITTTALKASTATIAEKDTKNQNITDYIYNVASNNISGIPTLVFSKGSGTEPSNWKFPYVPLGNDGKIDLTYIPQTAIERVHVVASTAAMVALTTATVQNGDVVKVTDKNIMYFVTDDTKLNQLAGYTEFAVGTAGSVAWANVTGKPALLTTASKATLSTGTTTATIKISWIDYGGNESPTSHQPNLVIPAAATNVAGLVTTGAQTFTGAKTFNTTATFSNVLNYSGIQSVTNNADYYLWMATAATATKGVPVYSTALSYNPSTKILNVIANQARYDTVTTTATIAERYVEYARTTFTSSANRITITNGSGTEKTFDINNYYPSTLTWATTASTVIGTLKNRSHTSTAQVNAVTFPTIPIASTAAAGIITASAQTIGGVKTFKDGAVFSSKVTFNGSADSTHSLDANASIVTQGGISVGKQLSAKQIRIDDNTSNKSVTLQFDAGKEVLSFVFE